MYHVRFPAPLLRPFIQCYWMVKTTAALNEEIFADGCADIVFNLSAPYQRITADAQHQWVPRTNLDAQKELPLSIVQNGDIHLVGVRFQPGGLAAFLPVPVSDLSGQVLDLDLCFGREAREAEGRLAEAGAIEDQAALLDGFFAGRLSVSTSHQLSLHVSSSIRRARGQLNIAALSRDAAYSIRSVDRAFARHFGFSPKFYARIVRFQCALGLVARQPKVNWADLAIQCGYADQPHFNKDFKRFTASSPEAYHTRLWASRNANPQNVQFLQDG